MGAPLPPAEARKRIIPVMALTVRVAEYLHGHPGERFLSRAIATALDSDPIQTLAVVMCLHSFNLVVYHDGFYQWKE